MGTYNKYPKMLAGTEITSRRQYDISKIQMNNSEDITLLNKKGTFTFANAYPYIFDAVSALCTEYATTTYECPNGEIRKVIERQEDPIETHYRAILTLETFMKLALNKHTEYKKRFLIQLLQFSNTSQKKILPLQKGYNILTEPVRIDLIKEENLTDSERRRFFNLKNRKDATKGKIVLIAIEFYKPLFECLLKTNQKGTLGGNYIQIPKALQAELDSTIDKLKQTSHLQDTKTKIDLENIKIKPVTAQKARATFLYLALHDNKKGQHIIIDTLDFADHCFPGYVERKNANKEQIPRPYISKKNSCNVREEIKNIIAIFQEMEKAGKMDNAQLIPIELDEHTAQYNHSSQKYRIKVARPRK
jgi:hypothetical protein